MRTDFVVQVARDIGAFFVLQRAELLFQTEVARLHDMQAVGHLVDTLPQADKFRRSLLPHPRIVVARSDTSKSAREINQGPQGAPDRQPHKEGAR